MTGNSIGHAHQHHRRARTRGMHVIIMIILQWMADRYCATMEEALAAKIS